LGTKQLINNLTVSGLILLLSAMDSKLQIILLVVCFAILAYRLNQKYRKKNTDKTLFTKKNKSLMSSDRDEDEYEPYSSEQSEL
jgi:hypothetical protein